MTTEPRLHPAYIAGLIDSDGHVSWGARCRTPRVGVTNTSRALMDALRHAAGGSVCRHDRSRRCEPDCTQSHVHVRSVCWSWELTGARAVIVLAAVRPYVVAKGERVDEVLTLWRDSFATSDRVSRRIGAVREARSAMAVLGWPPDAVALPRLTCNHRHALTPENVYVDRRGVRHCKRCRRRRQAAYVERQRGAET